MSSMPTGSLARPSGDRDGEQCDVAKHVQKNTTTKVNGDLWCLKLGEAVMECTIRSGKSDSNRGGIRIEIESASMRQSNEDKKMTDSMHCKVGLFEIFPGANTEKVCTSKPRVSIAQNNGSAETASSGKRSEPLPPEITDLLDTYLPAGPLWNTIYTEPSTCLSDSFDTWKSNSDSETVGSLSGDNLSLSLATVRECRLGLAHSRSATAARLPRSPSVLRDRFKSKSRPPSDVACRWFLVWRRQCRGAYMQRESTVHALHNRALSVQSPFIVPLSLKAPSLFDSQIQIGLSNFKEMSYYWFVLLLKVSMKFIGISERPYRLFIGTS
ncbi:hypothetical protein EV421DRAFT_1737421 [Armillaria borealis]|uniref:Uncharacterized protein n=1 Tax=Armillaria borealis TaxID=47425 RepID=A0AA39JE34_9AGAR|nr:hypothetical protein EV421DRAFT_1737421 [Armillaria borealis]